MLNIFREKNIECCFVELVAELGERLKRNVSEARLANKPSKRDVESSNQRLVKFDNHFKQLGVYGVDETCATGNHIKINNTNLPPQKVAKIICQKFNLK